MINTEIYPKGFALEIIENRNL